MFEYGLWGKIKKKKEGKVNVYYLFWWSYCFWSLIVDFYSCNRDYCLIFKEVISEIKVREKIFCNVYGNGEENSKGGV